MDDEAKEIDQLTDAEFTVLLPTMALLACAISHAMELGGGFEWTASGWQLRWPSEVSQGLGLSPTSVKTIDSNPQLIKVRFEPVDVAGLSYWSALFNSGAPALVVIYEVTEGERPYVSLTDDHWLHWPRYLSKPERVAACAVAIVAQERLAEGADWPSLAMKASSVGRRSILFVGVKDYLGRAEQGG